MTDAAMPTIATGNFTPRRGRRCSSSAMRCSRSSASVMSVGSMKNKGPAPRVRSGAEGVAKRSLGEAEDLLQIRLDVLFGADLGERQLLDEQRARRVEHLALAERQVLVALEQ